MMGWRDGGWEWGAIALDWALVKSRTAGAIRIITGGQVGGPNEERRGGGAVSAEGCDCRRDWLGQGVSLVCAGPIEAAIRERANWTALAMLTVRPQRVESPSRWPVLRYARGVSTETASCFECLV
jgi:hypothetical protein